MRNIETVVGETSGQIGAFFNEMASYVNVIELKTLFTRIAHLICPAVVFM